MPDAAVFSAKAAATMKPGAQMLLAESSGQVSEAPFDTELENGTDLRSVSMS